MKKVKRLFFGVLIFIILVFIIGLFADKKSSLNPPSVQDASIHATDKTQPVQDTNQNERIQTSAPIEQVNTPEKRKSVITTLQDRWNNHRTALEREEPDVNDLIYTCAELNRAKNYKLNCKLFENIANAARKEVLSYSNDKDRITALEAFKRINKIYEEYQYPDIKKVYSRCEDSQKEFEDFIDEKLDAYQKNLKNAKWDEDKDEIKEEIKKIKHYYEVKNKTIEFAIKLYKSKFDPKPSSKDEYNINIRTINGLDSVYSGQYKHDDEIITNLSGRFIPYGRGAMVY